MGARPSTSTPAAVPTSLTGQGISLRPPERSDAPAIGRLVGDPRRAAEVVGDGVRRWADDGYGPWVVEGDEGGVIGLVGLRDRSEDIAVSVRSMPEAADDGRAARALRLVVAHALEWLPDLPLRMRVDATDRPTRLVAEAAGLVHVPEEDHVARGVSRQVLEAPYLRTFEGFPPAARERVLDLWVRVNDSGGSVGFLPGAPREQVERALARREGELAAGRQTGVALMSPVGDLLGVGFLRCPNEVVMPHVRNAEVVMVDPDHRGAGHGRHLLAVLHRVARDEGAEIVTLDYREGSGLGSFYARAGYTEVGRVPGLIRVGEGEHRDGVSMMRRLD